MAAPRGSNICSLPDVALFAALELNRKVAAVDYHTTWQGGVSSGLRWSSGGKSPWSVTLSGGLEREIADAPDPAMVTPDAEDKQVSYVSAGVAVPVADGVLLNSNVTYSVSDSNYDLSNFDNLAASLGLSKRVLAMRLLAAAAAVLLLAVPALAETNVGVTAAVNQSASGSGGQQCPHHLAGRQRHLQRAHPDRWRRARADPARRRHHVHGRARTPTSSSTASSTIPMPAPRR